MFWGIKGLLKRHLCVPKIYFAKSVHGIEGPAVIFLPVDPCRLNCGLTGMVAYQRGESSPTNISDRKSVV